MGKSMERLTLAMAVRYVWYVPSNISITELLTPGITIPADIRNPLIISFVYVGVIISTVVVTIDFSSMIKQRLKQKVKIKSR